MRSFSSFRFSGFRSFLRSRKSAGITAGVAGVGLAVGAVLLSGGGDPGPRPVSADEAQRMAMARFRTYEGSPSEVRVTVPGDGDGGGTVTVRAVVDHRVHRAVGAYEVTGAGGRTRGVLAWDLTGVGVARGRVGTGGTPPRAAPTPGPALEPVRTAAQAVRRAGVLAADEWSRREFTGAALDRALRLVLTVAADRPDNAQLLARSGPLWLREDHLDGRDYGVFSGPRPRPHLHTTASPLPSASGRSPLSYWIDTSGDLRRITARVSPGHIATIDFVASRVSERVPDAPWKKPN